MTNTLTGYHTFLTMLALFVATLLIHRVLAWWTTQRPAPIRERDRVRFYGGDGTVYTVWATEGPYITIIRRGAPIRTLARNVVRVPPREGNL